jgi:pimeloyl-ACP methyl ester carboxylesterase
MKSVKIATTEMSYVDEGQGAPVVLLHGFPLDHTMWNAQITALAKSYRVIAPDLRGYGQTPLGEVSPTAGISMEQYADDVAALLDAIGVREPAVLVGFSMGGYIGWQFVRKYGQRLRGLVACDTRAVADSDEARDGRLKMAEKVAEWGSGRVAEMMGPKLFAKQTFDDQPGIVAEVRKVVERTPPAAIAASQRGMAARPDVTSFLPTITLPTLVVVGEHDAISARDEMEKVAKAIPGAKFVEIAGAGHMAPMERPDAVNEALVAFLKRIGP